MDVKLPTLTEQDKLDIQFAIQMDADFIAASFIRKASDVAEIKQFIEKHADVQISVIAKIENQKGVDEIKAIIQEAGGIMVARGDIGVQVKYNLVPMIQKKIILECNKACKPVIVATQMLESMTEHPRPSRAEATDVANAIFDGADAVMLSGETANGKYPVETVMSMAEIIHSTENNPLYRSLMYRRFKTAAAKGTINELFVQMAMHAALDDNLEIKAVISPTLTGEPPRLLSRVRPPMPIVAVTSDLKVFSRCLIVWGVYPILTELGVKTELIVNQSIKACLEYGYAHAFERVLVLTGFPFIKNNTINFIRMQVIGETLAGGTQGFGNKVAGMVIKVKDLKNYAGEFDAANKNILLTQSFTAEYLFLIKRFAAVIIDSPCLLTADQFKSFNPNIVVISGAKDAIARIEDRMFVTVDGQTKQILSGDV